MPARRPVLRRDHRRRASWTRRMVLYGSAPGDATVWGTIWVLGGCDGSLTPRGRRTPSGSKRLSQGKRGRLNVARHRSNKLLADQRAARNDRGRIGPDCFWSPGDPRTSHGLLCHGAWRGGRHDAPLHGICRGRPERAWRGHVAICSFRSWSMGRGGLTGPQWLRQRFVPRSWRPLDWRPRCRCSPAVNRSVPE